MVGKEPTDITYRFSNNKELEYHDLFSFLPRMRYIILYKPNRVLYQIPVQTKGKTGFKALKKIIGRNQREKTFYPLMLSFSNLGKGCQYPIFVITALYLPMIELFENHHFSPMPSFYTSGN